MCEPGGEQRAVSLSFLNAGCCKQAFSQLGIIICFWVRTSNCNFVSVFHAMLFLRAFNYHCQITADSVAFYSTAATRIQRAERNLLGIPCQYVSQNGSVSSIWNVMCLSLSANFGPFVIVLLYVLKSIQHFEEFLPHAARKGVSLHRREVL
jgi:hypothetical protein